MKEIKEVAEIVPADYIIWTVLVLVAIFALLFKVIPAATKLFNSARTLVNDYEDLKELVKDNTSSINTLYESMKVCKNKIENIEEMTERQQRYINESLEERELIIHTLLSVVQGLQEIGSNGPTKRAEVEIQAYLIKKAHERE